MNKYILKIILLGFLIFVPNILYAQEVPVGIDMILASENNSYIDSRLAGIRGQLDSIFRFSSYELFMHKELICRMGKIEKISLPAGKMFYLKPLFFQGNVIVMQAKILSGNRLVVDTQFRVSPGGSFFVGGPKTDKGVIILLIKVH
ncbi:MAG: hypothetical protein KAI43_08350 [Candidatus Aureabacteria bacterium]|nr:hypothetical protein [Candidatus Auribacterota bacterium]